MFRLILLLLPLLSLSQPVRFYHYIGLERVENDFIIVEHDYNLNLIKFGKDTINMSFTRVDLDSRYMWYCNNFPSLELVIVKDMDVITELQFYDIRRHEYYKFIKKGKKT